MKKLLSIISVLFLFLGCEKPASLTLDDLNFLINNSESTSAFDKSNMNLYAAHLEMAKKLESYGLIKVTKDSKRSYISQSNTTIGVNVINRIENNNTVGKEIPKNILAKLIGFEAALTKTYNLTLHEYLILVYSSSGDISAPGNRIFIIEKNEIKVIKSLAVKGYMKYTIYDDLFNGKPSKNFRWSLTEKGINFKVVL